MKRSECPPTDKATQPIRIIHVVGGMNRGGVETWLMHILRSSDPNRLRFDFIVHQQHPCAFDDEIRASGSRIIICPPSRNPLIYAVRFLRAVKKNGPYDVLHSHVYFYSGFVLLLGWIAGIRVRIAHSHTGGMEPPCSRVRRAYQRVARSLVMRFATAGLAVSDSAGQALYGPWWHSDRRLSVLHYGFDFARYREIASPESLRLALNIPMGRWIVGHIGRFSAVKNHEFLIQAFSELLAAGTDAQLIMVGGGELQQRVMAQVEKLHLGSRCTFVGIQADVTPYLGIMNLMIFPSRYEGLGIVILEAQAAGIPTLASLGVPPEAVVCTDLVQRMALEEGPVAWAQAAKELLTKPRDPTGLTRVEASRYGIRSCMNALLRVYGESRNVL